MIRQSALLLPAKLPTCTRREGLVVGLKIKDVSKGFSDDLADVVAAHPVFEHHAPGAMVIIETRWKYLQYWTEYNHNQIHLLHAYCNLYVNSLQSHFIEA